jgi:hypothetical protein
MNTEVKVEAKPERYNSGAAWKVKDKRTEKHPSYTGTINVDGVLYFADVWVKETRLGDKFLSMSFKKRDKQEGAEQKPVDELDDVPL